MSEPKPIVTFEDFARLDLRVAKVKSADAHPGADRLVRLQLDDGTPEGRQICAGIREFYEPEQLVGKTIVIAANLEPRKIRGELSQGMLLAASSPPVDGGGERQVVVLTLDRDLPPGSTIS